MGKNIIRAHASFSIPGYDDESDGWAAFDELSKSPEISWIVSAFQKHGIQGQFVDTMAGWGCLNQTWWECQCDIETSWGWCLPQVFFREQKASLKKLITTGAVIMMIHYINKDGDVVPYQ